MSRLRSHHHPRVYRTAHIWWSECDMCGWWSWGNDQHTLFVAALDHAESSLR